MPKMFGWRDSRLSMPLHFGGLPSKHGRCRCFRSDLGVLERVVNTTICRRQFSRVDILRYHVPAFGRSKDEKSRALLCAIKSSHAVSNDCTAGSLALLTSLIMRI